MNKKRIIKILIVIWISASLVFFAFTKWIEVKVLPRGAEVLHSYAETNMFEILNSTVNEVMGKYALDNSTLVDISRDENGEIASVSVNYALVNKIKSEISMVISQKLSGQEEIPVYVPLGAFSRNMFFMGKGPKLKFILVQRGVVNTDIVHSFESAGINQTLYTVEVVIDADVALMIPFYNTHTYMKTSAVLAQTLINGECPDRYLGSN